MELFISEAEIEDASMIIDYLNQVGGESDNLTYGLNECYLNEFEEMEVIKTYWSFCNHCKKRILEYGDCFNDDGRSFRNDQRNIFKSS